MPVTWASVMGSPLPGPESRLAMLPTTVTSRPSRIHTAPRPMTIIQCRPDRGSRSNRAGTLVVTIAASPPRGGGGASGLPEVMRLLGEHTLKDC